MKHLKILILYATRGGATKQCAELLAEKLENVHTVSVFDITKQAPSPADYDIVVLASSIRMGQMNKIMKKYIKEHKATLSQMPTAVGLCCGFPRQFEEYIETQLPKNLVCSLGHHNFGGELKPEKLRGTDKLIVKMVRSSIQSKNFEELSDAMHDLPELLPENVALLAEAIKKTAIDS